MFNTWNDGTETPGVLSVVFGNTNAYLDAWSGAISLCQPPAPGPLAWWGRSVARPGLALAGVQVPGGFLACFDTLTGRIIWKRWELEALLNAANGNIQPSYLSPRRATFMAYRSDGSMNVTELDLPTGAVTSRQSADNNRRNLWWRQKGGSYYPVMDRSYPVLENERITVKSLRTGDVIWTSPPDLAIAKQQPLNNGLVFASTTTNDLVLLDGRDGRLLRRWDGLRFDYTYAGNIGDAVVAYKPGAAGTNELLVLDPAASNVQFRGFLSPQTTPILSLGPSLPGYLLVRESRNFTEKNGSFYRQFLQVVDERGENPREWRLPRKEEVADASGHWYYQHYFAEDLILVQNQNTGDVLAYEHDPGDGGKEKK
jgi:hypothetical protein